MIALCACGALLVEGARGELSCPNCGAASRWLVAADGRAIAAADRGAVFVNDTFRRELVKALGLPEETKR